MPGSGAGGKIGLAALASIAVSRQSGCHLRKRTLAAEGVIMKAILLRSAALLLVAGSVATAAGAQGPAPAGPFAAASTLPFQAPRFDVIKDSDYQPGFEQAMALHMAEVRRIADNPAAPTFDNTIVALEQSGRMLDRVSEAFFGVVQANTNDTLDKVQEVEAPKLSQHQDAIYLDAHAVRANPGDLRQARALKLTPEQAQLLEVYHQQFVHAGAALSDADKDKLKALNTQLSTLETAFQQKLLAAAKAGALVVDDKAKLAGLDAAAIGAAETAAKDRKLDGKLVLPLQNTTQQPALEIADRSRDAQGAVRPAAGRAPKRATPTTRARRSSRSRSCARRRRRCSAIPIGRPMCCPIRWPRRRRRPAPSCSSSCPRPPPSRSARPPRSSR